MPSTGIPSSSSAGSSRGAPGAYTEAGPPERIRPLGARRRTSAAPTWCGSSSENTPHSRTRRAISCEYWPPKSSTSTSSCATARSSASSSTGWSATTPDPCPRVTRSSAAVSVRDKRDRPARRRHADVLLALELLALGLERRGDHQLGPVELRDVLIAAGGHRGPQRAHEVERAVVLARGAGDDLLEAAVLGRAHARAARERRMECGHAPVEAVTGSLVRARERRADHHGVGPAGERLRDVAPVAHAAVGDPAAGLAGLEHVLGAGGRDVGDRSGL